MLTERYLYRGHKVEVHVLEDFKRAWSWTYMIDDITRGENRDHPLLSPEISLVDGMRSAQDQIDLKCKRRHP